MSLIDIIIIIILSIIISIPHYSSNCHRCKISLNCILQCYINFPSEKPTSYQLPAPDYALYITFPEGHELAADGCHFDVTEDNLVLTLAKDDVCKGLWDGFKAGPGEEELEVCYHGVSRHHNHIIIIMDLNHSDCHKELHT